MSYLEVSFEEINDLLQEGAVNLRIVSEDPVKGAVIERLTEEQVKTPTELLEVLKRGDTMKCAFNTARQNTYYNRSHTLYCVAVCFNSGCSSLMFVENSSIESIKES